MITESTIERALDAAFSKHFPGKFIPDGVDHMPIAHVAAEKAKKRKGFEGSIIARILELSNTGLTMNEAAAQIGCSYHRVLISRQSHGTIWKPSKRGPRP